MDAMNTEELNQEQWKDKFVAYYTANAPNKVHMVSEAMMAKWDGKYLSLYNNLVKKYGPLGHPLPQAPPAPKGPVAPTNISHISEAVEYFEACIAKETPTRVVVNAADTTPSSSSVLEAKTFNAYNGLSTSSFTGTRVCVCVLSYISPPPLTLTDPPLPSPHSPSLRPHPPSPRF
jgi:hypothetical protein